MHSVYDTVDNCNEKFIKMVFFWKIYQWWIKYQSHASCEGTPKS